MTPADRRGQVDDSGRDVLGAAVAALEFQALVRVQRGEVLEQCPVSGFFRSLVVDFRDFQESEITFTFLGRADFPGHRVAGAQAEPADLVGRDVDVVDACLVRHVRGAQEAESLLQDFEHAFPEDIFSVSGMRLEQLEDEVLLARARGVFEAGLFGHFKQFRDRGAFEFREIHIDVEGSVNG